MLANDVSRIYTFNGADFAAFPELAGLQPALFGPQHTLLTGTQIVTEDPPPERDLADTGSIDDYNSRVQSFYT